MLLLDKLHTMAWLAGYRDMNQLIYGKVPQEINVMEGNSKWQKLVRRVASQAKAKWKHINRKEKCPSRSKHLSNTHRQTLVVMPQVYFFIMCHLSMK
jgi:IS1 family transposase